MIIATAQSMMCHVTTETLARKIHALVRQDVHPSLRQGLLAMMEMPTRAAIPAPTRGYVSESLSCVRRGHVL